MKKLIKITGCLLLAAIMGLSSCVKDEVAPEVAQLRQSQIAKLNAQVDEILANVASIDASTQYQLLTNAYKEANDALLLETSESNLEVTLANNDAALVLAEKNLETNRLAYETAVAAYEKFITEGAFATNVSDWLSKYNTAYGNLITMYGTRITKQEALSDAQVLLTISKLAPVLPWSLKLERLEESLAKAEASLAAKEESAAILEAVLADPTTLEAEIADVEAMIEGYRAEGQSLASDKKKLDEEKTAIGLLKTAANLVKTTYLGYVSDTLDALDDIADAQTDITDANKALGPLNADLAIKKATLASKASNVTAAENAYNVKLAAYNTANSNLQAAKDNVAAKDVAKTIAYNNWQGPPVVAANEAAYNTAVTAYNTAVTDRDAKQLVFDDASSAKTTAAGALTTAEGAYDTAFDNVYGIGGTVEAPAAGSPQKLVDLQNFIIADANDDIIGFEEDFDLAVAKIEETQDAYDQALEDLMVYDADIAEIDGKLVVAAQAISENSAWKAEMEAVKTALGTELTNLKSVISGLETAINGLEDTVADLNVQIGQMEVDIAKLEADVVKMEAELAELNNAITTQEALVAYWKKMLDDAIAGR